jgi:hypothetical protein
MHSVMMPMELASAVAVLIKRQAAEGLALGDADQVGQPASLEDGDLGAEGGARAGTR